MESSKILRPLELIIKMK